MLLLAFLIEYIFGRSATTSSIWLSAALVFHLAKNLFVSGIVKRMVLGVIACVVMP